MKKMSLIAMAMLVPAVALAHPSIVPHEHPHGLSLLPDLGALLLAAVFVGEALIVFRHRRSAK